MRWIAEPGKPNMEAPVKKSSSSRRAFIAGSIKCGALLTAGAAGMAAAAHTMAPTRSFAEAPKAAHPWPWPYAKLDPEAGRKLGHDSYYSGKGCSYGAFYPIIQGLVEKIGEPFTAIPAEMLIYGHGGGAGWGGLCGALNGAAAAICLVADKKTSDALISELFGWYTQALLPTDASNEYGAQNAYATNKHAGMVQQSKSGSIFCHVSGTLWSNEAGIKITDPVRKERCARLTGDTVAQAITILNANLDGTFKALYAPPEGIAACNTCHGEKGDKVDVLSKMDCGQCHGDPHAK